MKVAVILGTRPEIIKLSPIIRELERQQITFFLLHTGQHYSYAMDRIFFDDLKLPAPRYNLETGSASHGTQTGYMLSAIEPILEREEPDVVIVQGDTNSVLAGALAAVKLGIPVGHVEAGLRSLDRRMPEEYNRILTDHLSLLLFAPTEIAVQNLRDEGIGSKPFLTTRGRQQALIYNVGNSVVDATQQNIEIARQREADVLREFDLAAKQYVLLTAHRAENVDNPAFIAQLSKLLAYVRQQYHLPVVWPIHPRTAHQLEQFRIKPPALLIEPQGYLEFLALQANARLIITDSGGVQEEACVLGVPCVTIRKTTDRPETVAVGASRIGGTELPDMKRAVDLMMCSNGRWPIPYVLNTSQTIVHLLRQMFSQQSVEAAQAV
ncbi:MAG: UDP-N-acetylglucosamine 2-epimerase (non-hydrolyzing) [Acidobacteriota bacterium]|nr:UDP-N-acetylglucosamine 2-epimerase (non-hydrolyzing) [Blastocatellia bacterium]MDW8238443.1 UDP-N-acetylglucosamine 2-epimerase (non-hydrolyzing) [Acidobacteriota bacterium]